MIEVLLQVLFCLSIVLYWFSEGVTEGWTWSTKIESSSYIDHAKNFLSYAQHAILF